MTRIRTIALAAAVSAVAASTALGAVGDITAVTPAVTAPDQWIYSVATGPNGNLWFTMPVGGEIARMNPQTRAVTEFDLQGLCAPHAIALGPDGAMWFGCGDGQIGRITTAGAVTYYSTKFNGQTGTASPIESLITGPDGNLWFGQYDIASVGVISTSGVMLKRMTLASFPGVSGLTVGGDGNVWASYANDFKIFRITPAGAVTSFPVANQLDDVATASTGDVWGAPLSGSDDSIQVVAPSGKATSLPFAGYSSTIARGPLGFMWLGDRVTGQVSRVSNAGVTSRFNTGTSWNPEFRGLAAGADGNMWIAGNANPAGQATLFRVLTGAVPTILAAPSVSGTAVAGNTLTADPGAWTYDPNSYAYRWERCTTATSGCTAISGATASKYKVTAADAAKYLRVGVVATNLNGPSTRVYSKAIADGDTVAPDSGGAAGGGASGGTTSPAAYVGPVAIGTNTLLSTSGSSTAITTRYRVAGAGHFSQSATARGVKVCSTSRNVSAAGTYTATCRLNAAARAMLRTRPLRVTVTSTFTEDGLPTAIAQVRLTLPRTGGAAPVTG